MKTLPQILKNDFLYLLRISLHPTLLSIRIQDARRWIRLKKHDDIFQRRLSAFGWWVAFAVVLWVSISGVLAIGGTPWQIHLVVGALSVTMSYFPFYAWSYERQHSAGRPATDLIQALKRERKELTA